jgi:hypothetical protein
MQNPKTTVWLSRVMVGLSSLFFIMDGVMKLFKPSFVVSATTELGYPVSHGRLFSERFLLRAISAVP